MRCNVFYGDNLLWQIANLKRKNTAYIIEAQIGKLIFRYRSSS